MNPLELLRATKLEYPLPAQPVDTERDGTQCIGVSDDDNALWLFVDDNKFLVITIQNLRTKAFAQMRLQPPLATFLRDGLQQYERLMAWLEARKTKTLTN